MELMDVKELRKMAEAYLLGDDYPIDNDVPRAFIRILDAFDAMERERWMLWNWNAEHAEPGEPLSWSIEPEGGDGPCVREAKSPLEALLAAAATLEDKSDEG